MLKIQIRLIFNDIAHSLTSSLPSSHFCIVFTSPFFPLQRCISYQHYFTFLAVICLSHIISTALVPTYIAQSLHHRDLIFLAYSTASWMCVDKWNDRTRNIEAHNHRLYIYCSDFYNTCISRYLLDYLSELSVSTGSKLIFSYHINSRNNSRQHDIHISN